ncbi:hypothetical protein POM88_014147 [Heracleum sosnowskyi]|uniref:Uncharacterized protein n=1 Tax=Heracleum sosnowskyi TaxID=360622 RepID=A0AAD8J0J6_9APIA|nr:hypothetical protein POM88_014147 [Heracleum sosnowskyi]
MDVFSGLENSLEQVPENTKDSAGGPWKFVGLMPLFDPPRHDRRALELGVSVKMITECNNMQLVMNVGGPDRLSRLQMAETVATVRGYKSSLLKPTSASLINRGVKSPVDISMDINKLIQTQGFSPMKFEEGIRLILRMKVSDSYSHGYSAPGHDSSLDRMSPLFTSGI